MDWLLQLILISKNTIIMEWQWIVGNCNRCQINRLLCRAASKKRVVGWLPFGVLSAFARDIRWIGTSYAGEAVIEKVII